MRKYELIIIVAMTIWFCLCQMDQKQVSELQRCKLAFISFGIASLSIMLSPNVRFRIPELAMFWSTIWYGTRIFAKDVMEFAKILVQNIFIKNVD